MTPVTTARFVRHNVMDPETNARLVRRLREEHDVDALVVSDDPSIRAAGSASLELPSGLPEWLMPIVSIVPGQLFALYLTVARGLDPERPRWISKVTETR